MLTVVLMMEIPLGLFLNTECTVLCGACLNKEQRIGVDIISAQPNCFDDYVWLGIGYYRIGMYKLALHHLQLAYRKENIALIRASEPVHPRYIALGRWIMLQLVRNESLPTYNMTIFNSLDYPVMKSWCEFYLASTGHCSTDQNIITSKLRSGSGIAKSEHTHCWVNMVFLKAISNAGRRNSHQYSDLISVFEHECRIQQQLGFAVVWDVPYQIWYDII